MNAAVGWSPYLQARRAALNTNLLVYAEGFGDEDRVSATWRLLDQLSEADPVVPLQ
jgi:hypothetical protein